MGSEMCIRDRQYVLDNEGVPVVSILEKIERRFVGTVSPTERVRRFNQRQQRPGESFREFANAKHELACRIYGRSEDITEEMTVVQLQQTLPSETIRVVVLSQDH